MDTPSHLVIIGSGPAAWTAAIYASRALLSPTILAGEQSGGQLMFTTDVENYPGFELGIKGPDLMAVMRKQAERFGTKVIEKDAVKIERERELFKIFYGQAQENFAKSIIIATGAVANTLKLPGEDRLMGRGVGTCAVCDAPFYKEKDTVFVIGGGDSAMEEAIALAKFAHHVVILVRSDTIRASGIMKERIKRIQNIEIWYKSQTKEFKGNQKLESVVIDRDGKVDKFPADGVFYAIGHTPATEFLKNSGIDIDDKGYIKTYIDYGYGSLPQRAHDSRLTTHGSQQSAFFPTMTNIPGIFAAGDCVDPRYRQAVVAAGGGCMAALDAEKWIQEQVSRLAG